MRKLKNMVALATLMAMVGTSASNLNAQGEEYVSSTGGWGYQESYSSPALAPAIALGTVAIIAIVAVAIRHGSHGHGHGSSSSSSGSSSH